MPEPFAPLHGGPPRDLTPVHSGFAVVTLDWSPDGRYIAYTLMPSPVDAIAFRLQQSRLLQPSLSRFVAVVAHVSGPPLAARGHGGAG